MDPYTLTVVVVVMALAAGLAVPLIEYYLVLRTPNKGTLATNVESPPQSILRKKTVNAGRSREWASIEN